MIKYYCFFFLLYCFQIIETSACGNEYEISTYTRPNGSTSSINEYNIPYYFYHGFNTEELNKRKVNYEKLSFKNQTYQNKSDYALILLKLGHIQKSLEILKDLALKHPDEYNIIANLGTAYELSGDVHSALKYIKKAVRLNPHSHNGSEWIHVKILEAKVKLANDPSYLKKHSILELQINLKQNYTAKEILKFNKIKRELAWQLTERIHFVNAPDPIVADLLSTLAKLVALTEYMESALSLYDQSINYEPSNLSSLIYHRDEVKEILYWSQARKKAGLFGIIFLFVATVFYFIIWKIRKSKKNKIKQDVTVFSDAKILEKI